MDTGIGGSLRAGVRAEQPLDNTTRCPYGLYYPHSVASNRVFAVEDACGGFGSRSVDGYKPHNRKSSTPTNKRVVVGNFDKVRNTDIIRR